MAAIKVTSGSIYLVFLRVIYILFYFLLLGQWLFFLFCVVSVFSNSLFCNLTSRYS